MGSKKEKLVRFYYNDGKPNLGVTTENDTKYHEKKSMPVYKASAPLLVPDSSNGDRNDDSNKVPKFETFKVFPEIHQQQSWRHRILDPGSDVFSQWNRIFLISCLVALFVDPLFFYLPTVLNNGNNTSCMDTDLNLGVIVTLFRSFADVFYISNMIIKFRTAYVSPSSRVFGRGELVVDTKKIARRYMESDFFLDLFAALPLPQIVIWFIIPSIRSYHNGHANNTLVLIVLLQYIPRLYLIFSLSSKIIKANGLVTKTAWAGAAYNLLLYMLASHVLGASWYLLSIERYATCWRSECRKESSPTKCFLPYLDCGTLEDKVRMIWANSTVVFSNCNPESTTSFTYGIFTNALTKAISSKFLEKYFYCLWWGLQNLSSYGQNLSTSTFMGETSFAILISILGLVLFAHLIGNMQTYLQSITMRLEEWRLKRRDTEEWMRHRQLPQDLQARVRRFDQSKWIATRGVDEESILRALPSDLRRDIQCHLCLDLVRRVPFFSQMDDQLLDAICERLVSSLSTQGTYIVREGDPVTEMLFIIRGKLDSSTTNGGRTGFFNSIILRPGDFCGEELLSWALLPKSSLNLPSSTRTVKALVEVEAFALRAEDLKFVANQFRRLHSKKLQHTFRFYSHHWRTWAACFIQAAWHRHRKRMMTKSLSMKESFSYFQEKPVDETEQEEEQLTCPSHSSLGVTILASRFAANTYRGAQKTKGVDITKLQKPEEPNFLTEPHDDS
ncbi:cNMP_binding domain-containing protein [Cephalotus follicularis]|uniref:cNMP_binding domain-containing protein n=1 Tax=Cephalotus follicularis TaxID=3775 RepID=A0A1Q3CC78_CEPFO|nr:cNMP_binding domain-containing protein [Cephalotus follicularis]